MEGIHTILNPSITQTHSDNETQMTERRGRTRGQRRGHGRGRSQPTDCTHDSPMEGIHTILNPSMTQTHTGNENSATQETGRSARGRGQGRGRGRRRQQSGQRRTRVRGQRQSVNRGSDDQGKKRRSVLYTTLHLVMLSQSQNG